MLAALKVDTVIVLGVSTSHCVYATCRDAAESFKVRPGCSSHLDAPYHILYGESLIK
jgi:nicotinamidase-related amidase